MPEKYIIGGEPGADAEFLGELTALSSAQDDEAQEFGASAPFHKRSELLMVSAEAKRQDALEQLKRSLITSPEVSPSQALAAGLLAVIPTIGGYMAGRSVGKTPMSPHLRLKPSELSSLMTGGAQGGLSGMKVGLGASDTYLEGLQRSSDLQNKMNIMLAEQQLKQADTEAARGEQYEMAGMNREAISEEAALNRQATKENILLQTATRATKPTDEPPSSEEVTAVSSRLERLLGPGATDEQRQEIATQLAGAKTKRDLTNAEREMTRSIRAERQLTGDVPLNVGVQERRALAEAEAMPVRFRYVRSLVAQGLKQIPPGIIASYLREGAAAVKGTLQGELLANLDALAISAAKAAGAGTVSDQERQAMVLKWANALNRGNFDRVLSQDILSAKANAVALYRQSADSGNKTAGRVLNAFNERWAADADLFSINQSQTQAAPKESIRDRIRRLRGG